MLLSNWAWKMEPGSPDLLPFDSEEVWLFEDGTAEQAFKDEPPSFKEEPPSPSSRAQVATKLLQDLDDMIKKDWASYLQSEYRIAASLRHASYWLICASCSSLAGCLNCRSGNDRQMSDAHSSFGECWRNYPQYTHPGSNLILHIIGSPFYCESDALDHMSTEAGF
uniref:Uncharacterized protein n=1 Tax=Timema genevievae TaxID=629358 RepID=A0A7R9K5K0_TIMGE|nr:unnamed protein product [Timema genevievae]